MRQFEPTMRQIEATMRHLVTYKRESDPEKNERRERRTLTLLLVGKEESQETHPSRPRRRLFGKAIRPGPAERHESEFPETMIPSSPPCCERTSSPRSSASGVSTGTRVGRSGRGGSATTLTAG